MKNKTNKTKYLSIRTKHRIQHLIILGFLLTLFYAVSHVNQGSFQSFLSSTALVPITVSLVFLYLLWQWTENNLSKIPVKFSDKKIIKPKKKPIQSKQFNYSTILRIIHLAGYVFGLTFSTMVMIFLAVAHISGTGITRIVWNHYGELMIETVLFTIAFSIVVFGFIIECSFFKTKNKTMV
mgnify:FL=1